jgi:hypothetical protein
MIFNASIKKFLKENFRYLIEEQLDSIISFINRKNYLQILYTWGPELINGLLNHFVEVEDYNQCIMIRDTIAKHNKATGEQIKLQS